MAGIRQAHNRCRQPPPLCSTLRGFRQCTLFVLVLSPAPNPLPTRLVRHANGPGVRCHIPDTGIAGDSLIYECLFIGGRRVPRPRSRPGIPAGTNADALPCRTNRPVFRSSEAYRLSFRPRKSTWQRNQRRSQVLPTLAFVLVTGFSVSTIVGPGLADENGCHKLALKLNTPKHGCFEYRIATPHADVAPAADDE